MKKTILAAVLLAGTALATSASADPVTVAGTFLSDHCNCTGSGQPGGFASITVNDDGLGTGGAVGTLSISITLNNGNSFVAGGQDVGFGFNLLPAIGGPTITYAGLPNDGAGPGRDWTVVNGSGPSNLMQNAGALHADGFGDFEYGIHLDGNGASGTPTTSVAFSISGINLDWTDFAQLSTGQGENAAYMALDIFSGTTGTTGFVDLSVTPTVQQVPGPLAGAGIPGLVMALGGMFGLNRYRRRRQAA